MVFGPAHHRSQFFHRPGPALARRHFSQSQFGGNLGERFPLLVPQDHQTTVVGIELRQGLIKGPGVFARDCDAARGRLVGRGFGRRFAGFRGCGDLAVELPLVRLISITQVVDVVEQDPPQPCPKIVGRADPESLKIAGRFQEGALHQVRGPLLGAHVGIEFLLGHVQKVGAILFEQLAQSFRRPRAGAPQQLRQAGVRKRQWNLAGRHISSEATPAANWDRIPAELATTDEHAMEENTCPVSFIIACCRDNSIHVLIFHADRGFLSQKRLERRLGSLSELPARPASTRQESHPMWTVLTKSFKLLAKKPTLRSSSRRTRRQLILEPLEDRCVPAKLSIVSFEREGSAIASASFVDLSGAADNVTESNGAFNFIDNSDPLDNPNTLDTSATIGNSIGGFALVRIDLPEDGIPQFYVEASAAALAPYDADNPNIITSAQASAFAHAVTTLSIDPERNEQIGQKARLTATIGSALFGASPADYAFSIVDSKGAIIVSVLEKLPETYQLDAMVEIGTRITIEAACRPSLDVTTEVTHTDYDVAEEFIFNVIDLAVVPIATDIAVSNFEAQWNSSSSGGAEFRYQVLEADLPKEARMQIYWARIADDGSYDYLGSPVYDEPANPNKGQPRDIFLTPAQLGAPPAGATRLVLVADKAGELEEIHEDNNTRELLYDPRMTLKANYDGNSSDAVVGRFFSAIPINDQFFTVTLSESLAALRPHLNIKVGSVQDLSLLETADRHVFESVPFNPGNLTQDTSLNAEARINGTLLKRPNGADLLAPKTIDMEVLPPWLNNVSPRTIPLSDAFQGDHYVFAGRLLNVSTSTLAEFTVPAKATGLSKGANGGFGGGTKNGQNPDLGTTKIGFGGGTKNGLDLHLDIDVRAPLNAGEPTVTSDGAATITFLDHRFDANDRFSVNFNLNPQDLKIVNAAITFADSGSRPISLFPQKTFTAPGVKYQSNVTANVSYNAILTVKLNNNGTVNPAQTNLRFNLKARLSGTIAPELDLLNPKLSKILNALGSFGFQQVILKGIKAALQGSGILPTVSMSASVTGSIGVNGVVRFRGNPTQPNATVASHNGHVDFVPKVKIVVQWLGKSRTLAKSDFLSNLLAIHATF